MCRGEPQLSDSTMHAILPTFDSTGLVQSERHISELYLVVLQTVKHAVKECVITVLSVWYTAKLRILDHAEGWVLESKCNMGLIIYSINVGVDC
jgi:hypothetical protein